MFGVSCPQSPFVAYAEQEKFTALVNWTEPVATDNSGVAPTVTSNYQPPQRFNQGTHVITYTAVDQSGNMASCTITVKVIGNIEHLLPLFPLVILPFAIANFTIVCSVTYSTYHGISRSKFVLFFCLKLSTKRFKYLNMMKNHSGNVQKESLAMNVKVSKISFEQSTAAKKGGRITL